MQLKLWRERGMSSGTHRRLELAKRAAREEISRTSHALSDQVTAARKKALTAE